MPASYYNSGGLALRPIITPGQTDPLELAIKQAQLRNLQLQPQQADREFQQRQQQLAQTSALEQRGQDVTQRGQDVTSTDAANQVQVQRENIATQLAIHHETSQNALTEAYLAHAYANGIEPATLADILKQRGSPEYANALLTAHKQKATDAAQGLALGLDAATKSGNPQDIQAAIGAIKSKGQDYVDAVKPLVPKEYHPLFAPNSTATPGVNIGDPYVNDPAFQNVNAVQSQQQVQLQADKLRRQQEQQTSQRANTLFKRQRDAGLVSSHWYDKN